MPVYRKGHYIAPDWAELRRYEVFVGDPDGVITIPTTHRKARLLVTDGVCHVTSGATEAELKVPQSIEHGDDVSAFVVRSLGTPFTLMLFEGHWSDEIGGCGTFYYAADTPRRNTGDKVPYETATNFDSHYHDCDEYWMLLEGAGTVVVDGERFEVGAGDCVLTRRGHHHDIIAMPTPIRSAFLETSLHGQKRRGHLWNHTHGEAVRAV